MPAVARNRSHEQSLSAQLQMVLLSGAALNGFAVRIFESFSLAGSGGLLFGISPFEIIAVGVALYLMSEDRGKAPKVLVWPEALLVAGLMVPSSAVSWGCLAAYSAFTALRSSGAFRNGALLFLLLAGAALWSSIALRWFALPITMVEAHIIDAGLALFRSDLSVSGNVMGLPGGHQVILLAACSSAYLVPKAILALIAVALFLDARNWKTIIGLAGGLTVLLTVANWFRLGVMTWSYPMFQLAHGPVGANIFDIYQTALILSAGFVLCRR